MWFTNMIYYTKKKNNKKWYENVRFDLAVAYSFISFIFIIPDNQKYSNIKRIWKTSIIIWYTITHPYMTSAILHSTSISLYIFTKQFNPNYHFT